MDDEKVITYVDALNEELFVHYPVPFVVLIEILRRKFGGKDEKKTD